MFLVTKLFVYKRAKIIMLANWIRIQWNQAAYEVLYTRSKKDTLCFTLITACKTHFKQTYCEICHTNSDSWRICFQEDMIKRNMSGNCRSHKFLFIHLQTILWEIKELLPKELLWVLPHEYSLLIRVSHCLNELGLYYSLLQICVNKETWELWD